MTMCSSRIFTKNFFSQNFLIFFSKYLPKYFKRFFSKFGNIFKNFLVNCQHSHHLLTRSTFSPYCQHFSHFDKSFHLNILVKFPTIYAQFFSQFFNIFKNLVKIREFLTNFPQIPTFSSSGQKFEILPQLFWRSCFMRPRDKSHKIFFF